MTKSWLLHTALVLGFACAVSRADWPVYRGNPRQTGIAEPLPAKLELLWKIKLKDGIEGTAAIAKGVVYVGCFDESLHALKLRTGESIWTYKAGPTKAPASYHDGKVYIGNLDGLFHCVDAETGKKLWAFETGAEITSGANFTSDSVLFGSGDEHLYCLSLEGKERWKFKVPGGPVMGTPAIVGDRTFAAGCDSSLHVIDLKTGKEIGQPLNLNGQVGATPAVEGDLLYVGTMSGELFAIDWKKNEILWRTSPGNRQQAFIASSALTKDLVIAAGRDKRVYGLERGTGKEAWSFLTGRKIESSPVVAGKLVYACSTDHHLYILDLQSGKEIARHGLEGSILASPAAAEGCLVIATEEGTLHCFGEKK